MFDFSINLNSINQVLRPFTLELYCEIAEDEKGNSQGQWLHIRFLANPFRKRRQDGIFYETEE